MTLTWSPPRDNGGSDIKKYIIERRDANKRAWQSVGTSTEPTIKATNLTEGQSYYFQICAENEVGRGEWAETKPITPKSQYGQYYFNFIYFLLCN